MLKSYFIKLGHNVVGLAKNGEIGEAKFLELQPDLVTIDSVMPGMSGQELIKFINHFDRKNGKNTRIMLISSNKIEDNERRSMGVDQYLLKPVTHNKILTALQSIY